MRYMMIIKSDEQTEAGALPSPELIDQMNAYNEDLVKAGVLLEAEGLHASDRGARITFSNGKTTVTDGPFPEARELIAGYWIIQVGSRQEAIEWAKRVPHPGQGEGEMVVELRQVFEMEEFPPEVLTPEAAARERAMREEIQRSTTR